MSSFTLKDGSKLTHQASYQTVTSMGGPVPDPKWIFTDLAGHTHKYGTPDNAYPTLKPVWDIGYCGTCDDTHCEGEILDHYVCAECGVRIEPFKKWFTPDPVTICTSQEIVHSGWVRLDEETADLLDVAKYQIVEWSDEGVRGYFERSIMPEEAERLVAEIGLPERRQPGGKKSGSLGS